MAGCWASSFTSSFPSLERIRMAALHAQSLALCRLLLLLLLLLLATSTAVTLEADHEDFLRCIAFRTTTDVSQLVHAANTSSYSHFLWLSMMNLVFSSEATPKPVAIVTPTDESHVQAAVACCRENGLAIRIRSGGHDYEGLSYRSTGVQPFVIVDLCNLRSVDVDVGQNAAWVQAGATVGELYYRIAEKSRVHGFPAGLCPTVGIGGLISGGGLGTLLRKYGLAADNIVDARLVDANGRVLDRETMGEDLYWAIRGGGGGSFGVITAWKVKLAPVPPTVTAFSIARTLEQDAVELLHRWQQVAPQLHENLFIRVIIQRRADGGKKELEALFNSLFLGRCGELVHLMAESFPELGFQARDCREMSWIDSVLYFYGFTNGEPLEVLLDRQSQKKRFFKGKSDFVKEPIPLAALGEIWRRFLQEAAAGVMIMDPLGGKMDAIAETETPFPHRKGNLYNIQYFVAWEDGGDEAFKQHMESIRRVYGFMSPYVSKNPRTAYLNYKDLDLGRNGPENVASYAEASNWGKRYFLGNFRRLALVKGRVDPGNFFKDEQSIPPLMEPAEEGLLPRADENAVLTLHRPKNAVLLDTQLARGSVFFFDKHGALGAILEK